MTQLALRENSTDRPAEPCRDVPAYATRAFDFDAKPSRDGRTLEGYVAVFGATARIPDRNGDFDEQIHPGAFDRSLRRAYPVMQFEHGKDPRFGALPIGVYDTIEPDQRGYFVRGTLLDDPVIEPIRKAIAAKAIRGMSWRMMVPDSGQKWTRRSDSRSTAVDKRDIYDADVPEAGPVVFPAYSATSVSVRSLLVGMDLEEVRSMIADLTAHIEDLTGQPVARSAGGGDYDARPGGQPSPLPEHLLARDRALRMRGVLT